MIKRTLEPLLSSLFRQYPVVTVTGPRQSGKTTLCRAVFPHLPYINLENIEIRNIAIEDPRGFLGQYNNGAILDEIQRVPELLSYIQVIVDEKGMNSLFVLTGSQQFEVMQTITQSLAGRTALLKLLPLSLEELDTNADRRNLNRIIIDGFYPRIHSQNLNPTKTLSDYLETYIERDLRQMQEIRNFRQFEIFLQMCAGRVGQLLNMQSLANDVGVSQPTIKSWLNLLEASYVIFILPPYFANISRRLMKTPKLYFIDTGLAALLLGIEEELHVSRHPLRGNLVENLAVMEMVKYRYNQGRRSNLYFYRDNIGNEVDVIFETGGNPVPIEIKAGATINRNFFKGLDHFNRIIRRDGCSLLFYGGNERINTRNAQVWPLLSIHEAFRQL